MGSTGANDDEYDPWFDEVTLGINKEPVTPTPAAGETGPPSKVIIKNADGSVVDVDSLNVPESLRNLLKVINADDDGCLSDVNIRDALKIFGTIKAVFGSQGHMSHSEAEKGLHLLQRLVKEKSDNAGEVSYEHMPECVQDVMKEWDLDRSGSVSVIELSAAANAHKKVKKEGRLMRKIILGLSAVILLLLAGTFILSYMAVDMAKEMRGEGDGVMQTPNGEVVKVASSAFDVQADGTVVTRGEVTPTCPANTTCRRLASSPGVLQVAQSKPGKGLVSTLPDDVFKNLDMVTLKSESGGFLQLKVLSMTRVTMKSSKCGSVVKLHTQDGTLTIDDTELSADEQLAAKASPDLLASGTSLHGGRRLSAGFLEGFFTLLEDMEWECTSVALPNPEDIPRNYNAKMQVRERVSGSDVESIFPGVGTKPGIIAEDGVYYKTWTEDVLVLEGLRVAAKKFEMHPLQTQIEVTANAMNGAKAVLDAMGDTASHCRLGPSPVSLALGTLVSSASGLRLVGLTQESGRVLRQWRMEVGDTMTDKASEIFKFHGLVDVITLDYFDVDTDPTGVFQSGHPYRIHAFSPTGVYNVTMQYMELVTVDQMDLLGALDFFGVKKLSSDCHADYTQPVANTGDAQLVTEIHKLSRPAETPEKVPKIDPWTEWPGVVKYNADKLLDLEGDFGPYWSEMLFDSSMANMLASLPTTGTQSETSWTIPGGVDIAVEVEYSSSANSLPGQLKSIKASYDGPVSFPNPSFSGDRVTFEVSISEGSPYASSCATAEFLGSRAGRMAEPMLWVTCLVEEFDHIEMKQAVFAQGLQASSTFGAFTRSVRFGVVDIPTNSREPWLKATCCPKASFGVHSG